MCIIMKDSNTLFINIYLKFQKDNTYGSRLGHCKHINDSHCVIVNKFSQHQTHDFHWYTSTAVLQHLMMKDK